MYSAVPSGRRAAGCPALVHIFFGIILFITISSIPFARQHFTLVEISLMPFGKTIQ
ncbi:hypothetical protein FW778_11820 [Ginsengibacter hankyongi]|uniref:Inner membrane component domain-containing protein n=1 Tax=Ginsengibacter hankyongi TaxID=2607284 RepID=A0A5J5IHV4_9BACT|nr:hypothetical protein FW778_11820 [Ginsengibacter hankyongi]